MWTKLNIFCTCIFLKIEDYGKGGGCILYLGNDGTVYCGNRMGSTASCIIDTHLPVQSSAVQSSTVLSTQAYLVQSTLV